MTAGRIPVARSVGSVVLLTLICVNTLLLAVFGVVDFLGEKNRLEAILRTLTARAITRAETAGAHIDVIALAAVRATREATIRQARLIGDAPRLDAIVGVPLAGERVDGEIFDGRTEAAIFPGELPADPKAVFRGEGIAAPVAHADYRFVRFRPPASRLGKDGQPLPLPSIRLDRALEFLIGDRLQ